MTAYILILLGLLILFLSVSLKHVPLNNFVIVTFFGKRTRKTKGEGLVLLPFCPLIFDALPISMQTVPHSFEQKIWVGDGSEIEFRISINWEASRDYALEFTNHYYGDGNENNIDVQVLKDNFNKILEGKIKEYLREWANTQKWEDVTKVENSVFKSLVSKLFDIDEDNNIIEATKLLRNGNSKKVFKSLGVVIKGLIIEDIKLSKELGQQVEHGVIRGLQNKEDLESVKYINEIANELGVSKSEAVQISQTERGKLEKKINDVNINLSEKSIANVVKLIDSFKKYLNR